MSWTRKHARKQICFALLSLIGFVLLGLMTTPAKSQDVLNTKTPPRLPLDEFVKDPQLMDALRRGVRAMKARKPSDPLSWFFQAAIHGVTSDMIQVAASSDPKINTIDQKKFWNQCPHFGQASANFLPWHRGYTHYFEKILRAHTNEPRFALPYWDYSKPEAYRFPREFGIAELDQVLDGDKSNPLYYQDRNTYFTAWTHWSGNNLPYSMLTPEAVDWTPAREALTFFGDTEREGLGGAVKDEDRMSRGLLESFPHDPIHRLSGIIVPDQIVPDPETIGHLLVKPGFSLGMSGPPTAGFDPIFCVHHSNVDRLWATWSLIPGKQWGNLPPADWFEEAPWTFFDVQRKNGALVPIEVSRPRKDYFDSRKLGISFKDEDLTQTPLTLPDPLPKALKTPPVVQLQLITKITDSLKVSGARPEQVSAAAAAKSLQEPFAKLKSTAADAPATQRIFLRLNDVILDGTNATGYDVHLVLDSSNNKPKRTDPSFVGSIALFRHDSHEAGGHGKNISPKGPSELFDVTRTLRASGQLDLSKLRVVIVPFSLSQGIDGKSSIVEMRTLQFSSFEFLSKALK